VSALKKTVKILDRWSGEVMFTAKVDCSADTSPSVQLGLAVRAAYDSGARLVGARLDGADLYGARLVGARLDGASLVGASLVGASLDGANLVGARLDGANLYGASLVGARLVGAHLVGANLDGANLVGARLDGKIVSALIARVTGTDGYEYMLWRFQDGSHVIKAGRQTNTVDGYRAHVASDYPGTAKAKETLAILWYFEARLADTIPTVELFAGEKA
jgi:hypothetical protein